MTAKERIAALMEANAAEVLQRVAAERIIDQHLATIDALETALTTERAALAAERATRSMQWAA